MVEKKPSKQTKSSAPEKKESSRKEQPVARAEAKQDERTETNVERASEGRATRSGIPSLASKLSRPVLFGGLAAIILLAFLGYLFGKWFVVARVNGTAITRSEYVDELEKSAGKQVLESIATRTLIEQEASKKNVTVSNEELDAEIRKIESQLTAQGQNLDQVLSFQGLTRDGLREQIEIQKTVEKLVGNNVQVTDQEIEAFIEENPNLASAETDLDTLKGQAREQLKQQKTDAKIQELIQNLRQSAKIEYFNE
jgi:foldase protein PrsA